MMSKTEILNQKDVFASFRQELKIFKGEVEKVEDGEKLDLSKFEVGLYNGLIDLKNNVDSSSKQRFEEILGKLKKHEKIDSSDIDFLGKVLLELETKQIEQSDLKKMQDSIKNIRNIKGELSILKGNVDPNLKNELKEVKGKIETYKTKLKGFSKEHPIWTKALIMMLPPSLAGLFTVKTDSFVNIGNENFSKILNKVLGPIEDIFAQMAVMFFSWFAPDDMKKLLEDMKKLAGIDPKLLEHFNGSLSNSVTDLKEKNEILNDGVPKLEKYLEGYLPNMIKKVSGKNMTMEQATTIVKKLDLKNFFKDNTKQLKELLKYIEGKDVSDDANLFSAGFEGISLPFKLTFKLISLLKNENLISVSDIGTYFVKKSGDIFIGSFSLLGSGVELLSGKISADNFEDQVREMLDTDNETAKQILAIMLYRHGGIVFSTLGAISEYVGKAAIYGLSGETKLGPAIVSSLKGNIDEYLRLLKKLNQVIPQELKVSGVDNFRIIVDELEESNNAAKILASNPEIDGKRFLEIYKNKYGKLPTFAGNSEALKKLDFPSLRARLATKIGSLGDSLDRQISVLSSVAGKEFYGINSESALLDDLSKQIKSTTRSLSEIVRNDTLFSKIRGQLFKFDLMKNVLSIDPLYDKCIYKFQDVKSFKDFTSNLAILAKQSPELVRFVFDKFPIFMVAGLELSDKKSVGELVKNLSYLIPFFGSGYMLWNSLNLKQMDIAKAGVSTILLGTESGYATYQVFKNGIKDGGKNILKFITKPFVDVAEIATFLVRSGVTTVKMTGDFTKLLFGGQLTKEEFKLALDSFPKLSKSKAGVVFAGLFLGGALLFDKFSDNEINGFVKDCKKGKDVDLHCLDEKIKNTWGTLSSNEKAEAIALSYGFRTYNIKGVNGEYKNGSYKITLTEDYGFVPNYFEKQKIVENIKKILRRYGTDTNINLVYQTGLLEKVVAKNNLDTEEKKYAYFEALGYKKDTIKKWEIS